MAAMAKGLARGSTGCVGRRARAPQRRARALQQQPAPWRALCVAAQPREGAEVGALASQAGGRRGTLAWGVLTAAAALVRADGACAAATASTETLASKTRFDETGVSATAELRPAGAPADAAPVGTLRFVEEKSEYGRLRVVMRIELEQGALAEGEHGVQLRETEDMGSESYNPERVPHGRPGATKTFGSQGASNAGFGSSTGILYWCHVGDLGNVAVEADGSANALLPAPLLAFGKAKQDPVGRAVTIHANADSFETIDMGGIGAPALSGVVKMDKKAKKKGGWRR